MGRTWTALRRAPAVCSGTPHRAAAVEAAVSTAAREAGYLVNNAVADRVRLIPPLVLTDAQAAEFLDALPAFLDAGTASAAGAV